MNYKAFKTRNPAYCLDYWNQISALYSGGKRLLGDKKMLRSLLPSHSGESSEVYAERMSRAFYTPTMGSLVDYLVAGLATNPMTVEGKPKPDKFYEDFFNDASKPGGDKVTFEDMEREVVRRALLFGRSWTLVDLPTRGEEMSVASLAEEEGYGLLRAYSVGLENEAVIDWEEDDSGELEWALVMSTRSKRDGIEATRQFIIEEYTFYTRDDWTRYQIKYDVTKPPKDEDPMTVVGSGKHSFTKVPLVPLILPDALWAGDKLMSLARTHFNRANALDWGILRSLFSMLVANLSNPDPLNPVSEDTNRAVNQPVGAGRVLVLSEKDRMQYLSPDAAPFEVASKELDKIREDMSRVLWLMSLGVSNQGAALQRSGKSKQADASAANVILEALALLQCRHAERVCELVTLGRGDRPTEWRASRDEEFDMLSLKDSLDEATSLEAIQIPSKTYKVIYKFGLAKRILGDSASDEDLKAIKTELEESAEKPEPTPPPPGQQPPIPGQPGLEPPPGARMDRYSPGSKTPLLADKANLVKKGKGKGSIGKVEN